MGSEFMKPEVTSRYLGSGKREREGWGGGRERTEK
jgi:hypothetical protein